MIDQNDSQREGNINHASMCIYMYYILLELDQ